MPIPNFQMVMLPVLQDLASGERTGQETLDALAVHFTLSPEELAVRLPSGKQSTFTNRVAWAKSHMKAAGLIDSPRRGVYRLTERGRQVLAAKPAAIGMSFLSQYPEYLAFRQPPSEAPETSARRPSTTGTTGGVDERTPDDLIDEGYRQLRTALAKDLRERIAAMAPSAFEQLVVDLVTAMGYGGPQEDAGLVVGRGGDEGIDGLIKEDKLGLETIYIQAKRWQGVVGRPEIQRFAGALQGQRARKGVFITSSTFTSEARAYAGAIQTTIVLVDGAQLAELMIDHDVGVTGAKRIDIKRVDSDYFTVE
jgi:restriction system protein